MHRHFSFVFATVIIAAISFAAFPATAGHKPNHPGGGGTVGGLVDCAAGQTISDALAAGETNIVVLGTCDEAVEITTSNVTIEGHADGGAIIQSGASTPCLFGNRPAVDITGAHNVLIKNLTVSGPRHAVAVNRGGMATIENSDLTGNGCGRGIFVGDNSEGTLIDSTANGAFAIYQSTIRTFNSDMSGNQMGVRGGSGLRSYGSTFDNLFVAASSYVQILVSQIDVVYGPNTFNTGIGCQEYSTISTGTGASLDGAGVPIPLAAVGTDGLCSITGF